MTQLQDAPSTQASTSKWAGEDIGNIVMLEHVNTCVDDQLKATAFYLVTGRAGPVDSGLGADSVGSTRPITSPCP